MSLMKEDYIGNVYGQLDPIEDDCAVPYCRKPIKFGNEYFEHIKSGDILCSIRCVELHAADLAEPPDRDELEL